MFAKILRVVDNLLIVCVMKVLIIGSENDSYWTSSVCVR
jgi:hypothetical protein